MYLQHFGLSEPPFSITPNPRFVFLSEQHRDALAHLLYGITQGGGGGFVQLTGEVGTGKTTLCRLLLEKLPENVRVSLVLNPMLSPVELIESICEELHLPVKSKRGKLKPLLDTLNHFLLDAYAQGLRVVLIIDEAQDLSEAALEQVRLLTNLETPTQKLLQILLLGQPELRDVLAKPELRQLAQRVTARYHLTSLSAEETDSYLRHRFAVGGGQKFPFSKLAVRKIHQRADGIPRLINVIAERALLAAYVHQQHAISERLVNRAADEALAGPRFVRHWLKTPQAAILALLALMVSAWFLVPRYGMSETAVTAKPNPALSLKAPLISAEDYQVRLQMAGGQPSRAWIDLMKLWRVEASEASLETIQTCPMTPAPGLYCVSDQLSLDQLIARRAPVLVEMKVGEATSLALVTGADAMRVRILLDDWEFDVRRIDFERFYTGSFYALFRAPMAINRAIAPGDSGPAVAWVFSRLGLNAQDAKFDTGALQALNRLGLEYGMQPGENLSVAHLWLLVRDEIGGPKLLTSLE